MAVIPGNVARALFTKKLIAAYSNMPVVYSYLRSFFPSVETSARFVSIEVRKGTEKVAVDVMRGSDGNRNTFSTSKEKVIDPPFYDEFFELTSFDGYYRVFGSEQVDDGDFTDFLAVVMERIDELRKKIERAYELQCSQVLETGIIVLKNGDNINYGRHGDSLVNFSATPWTGAYNPYTHINTGCNFLRSVGKCQGGIFNLIMGEMAAVALFDNDEVKSRGPLSNINLDMIRVDQKNSVGSVPMGQITVGSYKVNLFTYPEFYDNASDVSTPYINPKKVILLPEKPQFKMSFAGTPQVPSAENAGKMKKGAYILNDYPDQKKKTHEYHVESAGVAVAVDRDQIWTGQVIA